MAGQGKFDALTKELITHVLGFQEGEENFVRSEQFVLSNLLYHHCLAVNSHAIRRSIEGLALKFTIHGQHHRAQQLTSLTSKFLASPLFKDHFETDIEWSLLSLMLHLSSSPTQVPVQEIQSKTSSPESLDYADEEQIDWAAHLRSGEQEYVLGPEEPLSDWSSDGESSDHEDIDKSNVHVNSVKKKLPDYREAQPIIKQPPSRELLEHLHRAKSWLSAKTHVQYWGPKCPQELPQSDHPAATVAKKWETNQGLRGLSQHLSEWAVMREVLWALLCPVPSHIFILNSKGLFTLKPNVTLASLTPGATSSLLGHLCEPLNQLRILDMFMHKYECPSMDPPTPATILSYAAGLRLWRHRFRSHIVILEDCIKKQERTCTLLWLEGELNPWLRTLATIFAVHSTAIASMTDNSPRYMAVRLLGTLCESVEGASEAHARGVLLQLLLHSLRHYLSIIDNWLLHGTLIDHAQEFIIQRDESVKVYDERFWREAFTVSHQHVHQNSDAEDPMRTILKFLSPLVAVLTSVGKSRELLAILDVQPLPKQSSLLSLSRLKMESVQEQSLEEVLVKFIKDAVCATTDGGKDEEKQINKDNREETDSILNEGDSLQMLGWEQVDPLLLASFMETNQESDYSTSPVGMDFITSLIEDIGDVPRAISVVSLLTSALRPLVKRKQDELSARLIRVLIEEYQLDRHCQAVRSVLLMEAGDIMHEFYSHLFVKMESGEDLDSISLTLHLQYCIGRLYPDLAKFFSVTLPPQGNVDGAEGTEDITKEGEGVMGPETGRNDGELVVKKIAGSGKEVKVDFGRQHTLNKDSKTAANVLFSRVDLPDITIQYQAPWPANLLLTESVMKQFNMLFQFNLSLKRVTNGLERLRFRDLASWHAVISAESTTEEASGPLQSRLHRLQLLRQWLLCFSRELHDHFANTVFLPYHQAVEKLFASRPSLNTIINEHERMLNKLISSCLMSKSEKILPLQIVLSKVFSLTQRLGKLWLQEIGRVSSDELTSLETQYAQVHRYIVNFLTTLVTTHFMPHMEGLTRTLVDTVPLLVHH